MRGPGPATWSPRSPPSRHARIDLKSGACRRSAKRGRRQHARPQHPGHRGRRQAARHSLVMRLTERRSLVQLGPRQARPRIQASETSKTPNVASRSPGQRTDQELLGRVGVPVPDGRVMRDIEDAWAAAQEVGLPVVVKPKDGNQGKAVSVNLRPRSRSRSPPPPRLRVRPPRHRRALPSGRRLPPAGGERQAGGRRAAPARRRSSATARHNIRAAGEDASTKTPAGATATARPDPHPHGRRRRAHPDQARPDLGERAARRRRWSSCATTAT